MTVRTFRTRVIRLLALSALLAAGMASAPAHADRGSSSTFSLPERDRGGAIIGAKVGALLPQAFTSLETSYFVEAEVGYLLPFLQRLLGITASFAVGMPTVSGQGIADSRVDGGSYSYQQTTQQFTVGLTALAKIPLGRLVPYIGIGPRLFIVRTPSTGSAAGGSAIPETVEQSKEIGVGVPIGLDVLLGPGRIFVEGQLLYSGSSQRSTGPSSFGAISVAAGYRFVL